MFEYCQWKELIDSQIEYFSFSLITSVNIWRESSDVIIPLRPVSRFIQQEDRLQNDIIFYLENHTPFINNGNNLLSMRNNFDVSDNKFQSWTISVGSV